MIKLRSGNGLRSRDGISLALYCGFAVLRSRSIGKWRDQFLGLRNHDVIKVAMQFPETAGNRSAHDSTYSIGYGTEPR